MLMADKMAEKTYKVPFLFFNSLLHYLHAGTLHSLFSQTSVWLPHSQASNHVLCSEENVWIWWDIRVLISSHSFLIWGTTSSPKQRSSCQWSEFYHTATLRKHMFCNPGEQLRRYLWMADVAWTLSQSIMKRTLQKVKWLNSGLCGWCKKKSFY